LLRSQQYEKFLFHGPPLSVYTDKASLFQIAPRATHHRAASEPQLTQIGQALQELDIEWIAVHSPQSVVRSGSHWWQSQ